MYLRVLLLATAVFCAGIEENIFVGILPEVAADLGVSFAAVGQLTTIFSVSFGLSALFLSAFTAHWERKRLLLIAMVLFAATNLMAAASPTYLVLFIVRIVMASSCAMVILLATSMAAELVPPSHKGRAIGLIFMGLSSSLVLGIPAGMAITGWLGWRAVFVGIALMSLPVIACVMLLLPSVPRLPAIAFHTYWRHLCVPKIFSGQLVSVGMIGGNFVLFAYLTPYLERMFALGAGAMQVLYLCSGVAGVLGAYLGGWMSDRIGPRRAVLLCPGMFLASMLLLPLANGSLLLFVPALLIWGCLSWTISPVVQGYLIDADPGRANLSIGLNVAAMQFGVALGAGLGGAAVHRDLLLATPWIGGGVAALALLCGWFSTRTGLPQTSVASAAAVRDGSGNCCRQRPPA